MDQNSKKQVIKKPTVIEGQGTGTSDGVKASVPDGSFIMPSDSTAQLGVGRKFDKTPKQVDVNLSNGEAVIPPDQVSAIGHDTLERMKAETHVPVDQAQMQIGESGEPELFFANGGFIGSPYPTADDIRKATPKQLPTPQHAQDFLGRQQSQGGGLGARQGQTYEGQSRNVNQPRTVSPAPSASTTANPTTPRPQLPAPTPSPTGVPPTAGTPGLGARMLGHAKSMGKGMTQLAAAGGLLANAYTPSEQYRERFGLGDQSEEDLGTVGGFAKDFGVRGLGYASDVGNILTGGVAGRFYQDNINREARQAEELKQIQAAKQPNGTPPPPKTEAPQPKSLNQTAGITQPSAPQNLPVAPQTPPVQQRNTASDNPYSISQNGNSFSYTNPQAASNARANGVPELQTQGVNGGMRGGGDPRGVANLLANTREAGPTQDQMDQALQQRLQGMIGTQRQPQYDGLNEQQTAERNQLLAAATTPIKGARGMTANQLNTVAKVQQGDEDRIQGRYQIDANNFAQQQQTLMREAGSTGRTAMQEQGATGRTAMQERGANYRNDSGLQHQYWRDGNNLELDNRRVSLDEQKEGPGIRTAQRIESLRDKYANSTSDEEKQSLLTMMNLYGGKDNQSAQGKDRFITVTRPADPENGWSGGQALYDTASGQWLDTPQSQPSGAQGVNKEFVKGATYTDPQSGKSAYLDENGNWVPYKGK